MTMTTTTATTATALADYYDPETQTTDLALMPTRGAPAVSRPAALDGSDDGPIYREYARHATVIAHDGESVGTAPAMPAVLATGITGAHGWLTPDAARIIGHALLRAADDAEGVR